MTVHSFALFYSVTKIVLRDQWNHREGKWAPRSSEPHCQYVGQPGVPANSVQSSAHVFTCRLPSPTALPAAQAAAKENRFPVNHRPRITNIQIPSSAITVNAFFLLDRKITFIKHCTQSTFFQLGQNVFLNYSSENLGHIALTICRIAFAKLHSVVSPAVHGGGLRRTARAELTTEVIVEKPQGKKHSTVSQGLPSNSPEPIQGQPVPQLLGWLYLMENVIIVSNHFPLIALTCQLSKLPTFISYNMKFLLLHLTPGVASFFTFQNFSFIDFLFFFFFLHLCLYAIYLQFSVKLNLNKPSLHAIGQVA